MSVHDQSSFESLYAGQPRWEIGGATLRVWRRS